MLHGTGRQSIAAVRSKLSSFSLSEKTSTSEEESDKNVHDEEDNEETPVDKTLDCLSPDDKILMTSLLSKLMCPGFPLDRRCLNISLRSRPVELKSTPGTYLEDSKSTFPISEHLSPQAFLMKAGFSAFQAHSVCENKRIKCKLTAAITEARVWLNCMTKNQALLLYGLSVKMLTNNMPPLFLQLTEAIANNRIQNMMQLFEYLRVLKLVGKLPLQSKFNNKQGPEIQNMLTINLENARNF